MITIEDIINNSMAHPMMEGGRQTIFETPLLKISIVGGRNGLYGDFKETFEVAILEKKTSKFMSNYFYPELSESSGDTMPWLNKEQTLKVVNELIKK